MTARIALAGNPNCGKTTLYNKLVGGNERVGNYPGVTVELKSASARLGGSRVEICDLPGVYSLAGSTPEQRVARDFLLNDPPDAVINLLDSGCVERGLALTLELIELGIPTVVAVGMLDEAAKSGISLDLARLAKSLGVPVVGICAPRGDGLDELTRRAEALLSDRRAPSINTPKPLSDEEYIAAAERRFAEIDRITADCLRRPRPKPTLSDRADRLLLGRFTAIPIFVMIMAAVFFVTFGRFGNLLTQALDRLIFDDFAPLLEGWLSTLKAPELLRSLLVDGALGGVGGVVVFLPQIALLFLCLGLLEDSGYMARAALIADRPLRAFGLDGASFLPLMMGFGCTVAAELSSRTIGDDRVRRRCCAVAPFISCAARWAVYAVFISAFFAAHRRTAAIAVYALGIVVTLGASAVMAAVGGRGRSTFLLELPPYRAPRLQNVAKRLVSRVKEFLIRAGTLIFLMSVLVWALGRFNAHFHPVDTGDSVLADLGRAIAPIFAPLGFGDWRAAVALLSGLVAKEGVVSTMAVLYAPLPLTEALVAAFDPASACAFIAFCALYTPCVSALAAMARELRSVRRTAAALAGQLVVAYAVASAVHLVAVWVT